MADYRNSKGQAISLIEKRSSGGEGTVWRTNRSGCLAKIYHSPTNEATEKLKAMIANPPDNPTKSQNHISIAWPTDLVYSKNKCVGFLMPEIPDSQQLLFVYNAKYRQNKSPKFNWYCLHITALNLASAMEAIHQKGYVVGDMKTQNILVTALGLVSIIDTDSFQVKVSQTGKVYRCSVGSEGFNPPELIGKDLRNLTQTRFHDRFRLGIIIYYLLFGSHPFQGKWKGTGDPPGQDESVSQNLWPYSQSGEMQLSRIGMPLDILHPELKRLFLKCFNDGYQSPSSRPSPGEWFDALTSAIKHLKSCSQVTNHIYSGTFGRCYWCERANTLGVDIFPPVANPIKPFQHKLSPKKTQAPTPKLINWIWLGLVIFFCLQLLGR
ncbi:hypothetical protein PN466_18950 [Roseofilum reptotaenium CS-1145]|uniref:Protein kinase domain-containing protein n=1 Tax=Roseofilum reptotaenium AO1-A TaxID=1925591 RepID=A0A1L9QTN1_9CYAN|nr:hypothetical protein [Roseofilum reptotaenium]MDB9519027.1 hypothetical protein [Roseofilum reptotaenium CS-1145]OJJ26031.1 hypothetical protein BI308_08725 [Roseofilum reptotaenium AO1-A]